MVEKKTFKIETLSLAMLMLTPIFYIVGSFFANLSILLLFLLYIFIEPKNKFLIILKKYNNFIILIFIIFLINILNSEYKLYSTLKGVAFLRYFLFSISLAFLINFISHNSIKIYTKFLISLILFVILDSYIQFFFGKDIFGFSYVESYNRITGPFGDEMIIGSYLLNIGFLSLSLLNYFYKVNLKYNFLLFLLLSITILFTGERSAFLSTIYFFILIFLISKKKKLFFLIGIALIIITTLFIKNSQVLSNKYDLHVNLEYNVNTTENTNLKNNSYQFESKVKNSITEFKIFIKNNKWMGHYVKAITIFKDNLFFGSGFRSYRHVCLNKYENKNLDDLKCSIHPHNFHLEMISDNGITGYAIFIILVLSFVYKFIKEKHFNNFGISILFCLIITFIFPFKPTGSFFTTSSAFIFWLLIGHFFGLIFYQNKKTNS